jgi:hypothetical protein
MAYSDLISGAKLRQGFGMAGGLSPAIYVFDLGR